MAVHFSCRFKVSLDLVRLSTQKGTVLKISRFSALYPFHMYSQFLIQVIHPETIQTDKKLSTTGYQSGYINSNMINVLITSTVQCGRGILHSEISETCHATRILVDHHVTLLPSVRHFRIAYTADNKSIFLGKSGTFLN